MCDGSDSSDGQDWGTRRAGAALGDASCADWVAALFTAGAAAEAGYVEDL